MEHLHQQLHESNMEMIRLREESYKYLGLYGKAVVELATGHKVSPFFPQSNPMVTN